MRLNKIGRLVFPLVLVFISLFLAYRNFLPATWLTGWDNLQSELNLLLNIRRSFSAVWQEYQGVGVLGGMAHAADLTRLLILLPFSFFIPLSFIRYLWVFLMLLIGPLGVYFLLSKVLLNDREDWTGLLGGFIGGMFYLLNLATVQYFYTPFETFVGFFGFLPWLLYFALSYFKKGGKKRLLSFFIVSILATSAFYVQTMFVVYCLFLLVFSLEVAFSLKLTGIIRSVKLALVTFAANAFWLLPVLYFTLTGSSLPALSKINRISTPETQLMNYSRGSFADISLLKGYWFDYYDWTQPNSGLGEGGKYDYLFADWIVHLNNPVFVLYAKVIFGLVFSGLTLALFRKKALWKFSGLLLLFISYTMLATINPPFGVVYNYISDKVPLFSEIFRNVFTKWSVAVALVYALGLGYFIFGLGRIIKGRLKVVIVVPVVAVLFLVIGVVKPVFDGKLISGKMKVDIPKEYLGLGDWLNTRPQEGRIAYFPFFSYWGWNFHEWGYGGSGFLWYGIKQPILDRAFNVWSPYNETYQNEITYALFNKDNENFENTLKKFEVKYLISDESIIYPGNGNNNLFISELKEMVAGSSGRIREVKKFGFITVFETDEINNKFISVPESYTLVNSDMNYSQLDFVYSALGTYLNGTDAVSYPFANFDGRMGIKIYRDGEKINIESAKYNAKATFPVVGIIKEDFNLRRGFETPRNCDLKGKGSVRRVYLKDKVIYASENGGVSCDYFYFPEVKLSQSYILRVKGENSVGRGLKIYLQNNERGNMDIEELLPTGEFDEYFFIYPNLSKSEAGYTLNVETRSFGTVPSENSIENIEFIPVDTVLLSRLIQNSEKVRTYRNNLKIIAVDKVGTYLYRVQTQKEGLLVLGQGYNDGWLAFSFQPSAISKLEHVKVNSWENGWTVPGGNSVVYILFWPQLLEWGGLLILLGGALILIISGKKRMSRFPVDRDKR